MGKPLLFGPTGWGVNIGTLDINQDDVTVAPIFASVKGLLVPMCSNLAVTAGGSIYNVPGATSTEGGFSNGMGFSSLAASVVFDGMGATHAIGLTVQFSMDGLTLCNYVIPGTGNDGESLWQAGPTAMRAPFFRFQIFNNDDVDHTCVASYAYLT